MDNDEKSNELTFAAEIALEKLNRSSTGDSTNSSQMKMTIPASYQNDSLIATGDVEKFAKPVNILGSPIHIETTSEQAILLKDDTKEKKSTNFETMMNLIKGNVGTGILAMPEAFSNAGLWVGTLTLPLLGVICIHCMHILVKSSKILAKGIGRRSLDYPSVAMYAFQHGPPRLRFLAKVARFYVNLMLLITQFGFCCVYFVFVAKSLQKVILNLTCSIPLSIQGWLSVVLPFMIVFNFIRSLKNISKPSAFAVAVQSAGLAIIFVMMCQDLPSVTKREASKDISKLPLYFGTAIYAFEGISVILPLENKMKNQEDFGGCNGVLNTGMVIVASLYTAVGFFGYLKYGDDVEGSVTLSLSNDYWLSELVRIMFAIAIFLSYGLQMYIPVNIIWPWMENKFNLEEKLTPFKLRMSEYLLRAGLVTFTFALASLIPDLDSVISLVGALASSSLALIIPPLIEIMAYWGTSISRKLFITMIIKDILISTFGLAGFVIGTYASVDKIITNFSSPPANETFPANC